ncbi:MAG: MBL fold metallo-hydrolase [Caulobacteraceae bacterium]
MIPYVRAIEFEPGRVDRVSPLIRRVIAANPGPFTYTGTGTYIVGDGEVAVIDPGPDLPEHLNALLAATAGERVSHILVTHTHRDHSPLAAELARRTGATVWGMPAPGGEDDEDGVHLDEGHDTAFAPDRLSRDSERITGPGWTLEAILTPGHASNHVCYALIEENALFSGDHVMGWSTTVISPPDGDMAAYFQSLDRVAARRFATLWPTHGPPVTEAAPFLAAYKAHRLERERQILAELAKGPRRIADMVPPIYAGVDPWLYPAAAHSMLAHLIQMTGDGRTATDGHAEIGSLYRLA